jgi:hypothetical protein
MGRVEAEKPKRSYASPVLVVYGNVQDLTQSNRRFGAKDSLTGRTPTRTSAAG